MSRAGDERTQEIARDGRDGQRPRAPEQAREPAAGPVPAAQPVAAHCRPARATAVDILCPVCGIEMRPEHAHYRCLQCGYRDSCCF